VIKMTNFRENKRALQAAANRGGSEPSEKQINFICVLLDQTGATAGDWGFGIDNFNAVLTKSKASGLIDKIKVVPKALIELLSKDA